MFWDGHILVHCSSFWVPRRLRENTKNIIYFLSDTPFTVNWKFSITISLLFKFSFIFFLLYCKHLTKLDNKMKCMPWLWHSRTKFKIKLFITYHWPFEAKYHWEVFIHLPKEDNFRILIKMILRSFWINLYLSLC